jgi:hypothetical protein
MDNDLRGEKQFPSCATGECQTPPHHFVKHNQGHTMKSIITFLQGKKTYGVVIAMIGCVAATLLGYHVPDWVWPLLGATALATLRAALKQAITMMSALQAELPPDNATPAPMAPPPTITPRAGCVSIRGLLTGMAAAIVLIVLAGAFTGCTTVKADAADLKTNVVYEVKTMVRQGNNLVTTLTSPTCVSNEVVIVLDAATLAAKIP